MFHSPGRDTVECLGEVDKDDVEIHILFLTFLLDLPCSEYHVYCPSVLPKTTLAFWSSRRRVFNLFKMTLESSFPATLKREISR